MTNHRHILEFLKVKYKQNQGFHRSVISGTANATIVSKFSKESFDEVKLPLIASGRLINSGPNKDGYLPPEELKESLNNWVGTHIIDFHDKNINAPSKYKMSDIAGVITRTFWNEKDQAIDYEAEIYNRHLSNLIVAGIVNEISVEYAWRKRFSSKYGKEQFGIIPELLCLVKDGHMKGNSIKPVEDKNVV